MLQETLLILLIVLILWPKPVLGAARWIMRHAFAGRHDDEPESDPDRHETTGSDGP